MRRWFAVLACMLILVGCAAQAPAPKAASGTPLPAPSLGTATLVGRLTRASDGAPIAKMLVRLGSVFRQGAEGAYAIDGARSPGAQTDADGRFVFSNVKPSEYVLAITYSEGYDVVVVNQKGDAQTWKADSGQIVDMGVIPIK